MAKPTISGSTMLTGFPFITEIRKDKEGTEYECITILMCKKGEMDKSPFFKTEKGNIGFNFSGWETDKSKWDEYKQTHSLTADFGKEENQRRQSANEKMLNVGKLTDWDKKNGSSGGESPANEASDIPPSEDDLPF